MSSLRLVCGDGSIVRLPRDYIGKMSLFSDPEIASCRSYTLRCKASCPTVNILLDWLDGEVQNVEITKENFSELRSLCEELGFTGLDKELGAFDSGFGMKCKMGILEERVDDHELQIEECETDICTLKQEVKRVHLLEERLAALERAQTDLLSKHNSLLEDVQRQFSGLATGRMEDYRKMREFVSQQVQFMERNVKDTANAREERRIAEAISKVERAVSECARRSDVEGIQEEVAQLKENEKQINARVDEIVKRKHRHRHKGKEFVYNASKPLDGMIAYLTRECGGNVHNKGVVNVTASSVLTNNIEHPAKDAVDLGTDSQFETLNELNSWLCFDFKDRRIIPTSYSIRSYNRESGCNHLKSWVVELSNDGSSWTEVDRRDNNYDLNEKHVIRNFKLSRVPNESFRFIRLRQTGPNHWGMYWLKLTSWEIFGTLCEGKIERRSHDFVETDFVYNASKPLDGMIAYLTRECGGNVHDKGVIAATSSGVYYEHVPENAVDVWTDSYFASSNEPNSWICYDFKDRRVIPTSYSVRSYWNASGDHLKSWVVEVSNDGTENSWKEIDRRDNNNDLNGKHVTANFKISRVPNESFRFFRLRQTAKNHQDRYYLAMTSLEIFGTLSDN